MNEERKIVNYELAYRLLILIAETTNDRIEGSSLNLGQAHKILGVSAEEADAAIKMLSDDLLLYVSSFGSIHIG
jgi:hypothetical protein